LSDSRHPQSTNLSLLRSLSLPGSWKVCSHFQNNSSYERNFTSGIDSASYLRTTVSTRDACILHFSPYSVPVFAPTTKKLAWKHQNGTASNHRLRAIGSLSFGESLEHWSTSCDPSTRLCRTLGPNEIRRYIDLVSLIQTFRSPIEQEIEEEPDNKGYDSIRRHIV
jgi:hypothetical protein